MKGTPRTKRAAPEDLRFTASMHQDGEANVRINSLVLLDGEIQLIVTVGTDLAKNVYAAHGVDDVSLRRMLTCLANFIHSKLTMLFANLRACLSLGVPYFRLLQPKLVTAFPLGQCWMQINTCANRRYLQLEAHNEIDP